MPALLSSHKENKFLAPLTIDQILTLQDGTILTYNENKVMDVYLKNISRFDPETGNLLQSVDFKMKEKWIFTFHQCGDRVFFFDEVKWGLWKLMEIVLEPKLKIIPVGIQVPATSANFALALTEKSWIVAHPGGIEHYNVQDLSPIASFPITGQLFSDASPDGKLFAYGSSDEKTISVVAAESGKVLGEIHTSGFMNSRTGFILFSPDSKQIMTAGDKNFVEFWSSETFQPISEPLTVTDDPRQSLVEMSFSRDGKTAVFWSRGMYHTIFDLETRKRLLLVNDLESSNHGDISADKQHFFTSVGKRLIKISLATAKPADESFLFPGIFPKKLYDLPEQNQVLAFYYRRLVLLNRETGKVEKVLQDMAGDCYFHPGSANTNIVVPGFYNAYIAMEGAYTGNLEDGVKKHLLDDMCDRLAISDRYIVAVHGHKMKDKHMLLFDHDGNELKIIEEEYAKQDLPREGLLFFSNDRYIAGINKSWGYDEKGKEQPTSIVSVWDLDQNEKIWRVELLDEKFRKLDIDETDEQLLVCTADSNVLLFEANSGKLLWKYSQKLDLTDKKNEIVSAFVRSGKVLLVMRKGEFMLLDSADGKILKKENYAKPGFEIASLMNNKELITIQSDTSITVWDLTDWLN